MKICEDRHALVGDFQYSIFIIYYLSIWEKVSEWVDDLPKDLHHRYLFVKIVTHGLVTFSTQFLYYTYHLSILGKVNEWVDGLPKDLFHSLFKFTQIIF